MHQKTKTFKNQQPHTKKSNNKKQEKLDVLRSNIPLKTNMTRTTKTKENMRPHGENQRSKLNKQMSRTKKDYKISNHTLKNAKKNMI